MTAQFDAAAWLGAFESLGGGYVRNSANQLCLGWIAYGKTDDDQRQLRRLFNAIDADGALWDAVDALVSERGAVRAF